MVKAVRNKRVHFGLCFLTLLISNLLAPILCRTISFDNPSPFESEKNPRHESFVPKDSKSKDLEEKSVKTTTPSPVDKDDSESDEDEDFCVLGDDDEAAAASDDEENCFISDDEDDSDSEEADGDDDEDECDGHEEDESRPGNHDVVSDHGSNKHLPPKDQNEIDITQYHKYSRKPKGPKILTEKWLIHERIHSKWTKWFVAQYNLPFIFCTKHCQTVSISKIVSINHTIKADPKSMWFMSQVIQHYQALFLTTSFASL